MLAGIPEEVLEIDADLQGAVAAAPSSDWLRRSLPEAGSDRQADPAASLALPNANRRTRPTPEPGAGHLKTAEAMGSAPLLGRRPFVLANSGLQLQEMPEC
jgi:hypothetical protein